MRGTGYHTTLSAQAWKSERPKAQEVERHFTNVSQMPHDTHHHLRNGTSKPTVGVEEEVKGQNDFQGKRTSSRVQCRQRPRPSRHQGEEEEEEGEEKEAIYNSL